MRGRKPKPLTRQISEGDPRQRGKRTLVKRLELQPPATRGLPECPRHLRGRARAAWNFWREELEVMKLDARPDAHMLEGACVAYARAVQADMLVNKSGILVEEPIIDREGECIGVKLKNHPSIAVSNKAWAQLRTFSSEFGLSPVSRTRLTLDKPDTGESDLLKALSQPRERRAEPIQ